MKGWRKKRLYGGVLKRFIEYYMAISNLIVIFLSMENLYVFHNSGGVIDRDAMKHILGSFFILSTFLSQPCQACSVLQAICRSYQIQPAFKVAS